MGFALLWLESIIGALLLSAFVYSISSRAKSSAIRVLSRLVVFFLPILMANYFTVFGWFMQQNNIEPQWLLYYSLSWGMYQKGAKSALI